MFEENEFNAEPLLVIQSDGAVIDGMQFILHSYSKIEETNNLFHNISPCAIVCTDGKSKTNLLTRLRRIRKF